MGAGSCCLAQQRATLTWPAAAAGGGGGGSGGRWLGGRGPCCGRCARCEAHPSTLKQLERRPARELRHCAGLRASAVRCWLSAGSAALEALGERRRKW